MENLNTSDFELKHITFLLNFLNTNKKITHSILNYILKLCQKDNLTSYRSTLESLMNDFQIILDENSNCESSLIDLENKLNSNNLTEQEYTDIFNVLSQTQTKIYDSHLKLNTFMPRLFDFVDDNIDKAELESYNSEINQLSHQKHDAIDLSNYIENTNSNIPKPLLLISEKTDTVTLPSTGEQIPFSYYKHSSWARFKEAYKLMKIKEKSSLFKALDLAFELAGRYDLHPAIISACKNIDELDIYLSCLDNNTTKDFPFFEIKFEVSPI